MIMRLRENNNMDYELTFMYAHLQSCLDNDILDRYYANCSPKASQLTKLLKFDKTLATTSGRLTKSSLQSIYSRRINYM